MGATRFDAPRRTLKVLSTLLVTASLMLAACSSADDGDSAASSDRAGDDIASEPSDGGESELPDTAARGTDDTDREPGAPPVPGEGTGGDLPVAVTAADLGRSLIYTATATIEVRNVLDATRQTQEVMAGLGGVLFGQETTTTPRPRTTLVYKVQPDDFSEALTRLESVGRIASLDASADDVTERVVDLQSQIRSAEISVDRLRELLDAATSLEDVAALERELLAREGNLELLRGQLRTIEDRVALATITVVLTEEATEPAAEVLVTAYEGDDDGERCPGDRRLEVDDGTAAVLCVTVTNTGNVALTKVEVRDPGLDLERSDFTLSGFGGDDQLAPGESVVAWAPFDATADRLPRPNVSTVPVDDRGQPLRTATAVSGEPIELLVRTDDSLPGFTDALARGWGAVEAAAAVAVVLLGLLLPIAAVAAVPLGVWFWVRRSNRAESRTAPAG